jgi:hypothetical protein
VTVVAVLQVFVAQLVKQPSRQFDTGMRGCAGRQSGRCTPQWSAAQHMQADVDGRRFSGRRGGRNRVVF